MDKKYKTLLSSMIILVIVIIIILLILIKFNLNNGVDDTTIELEEPIDFSVKGIHVVEEKSKYYTVRDCINNYLNYLDVNNSVYYVGDEKLLDLQNECINNLLSQEYKDKNNISLSNLSNYIETLEERCTFIPLQMRVLEADKVNKYITYGVIQTSIENRFIKEAYYFVNLDYINNTFSIEPVAEQYQNIDDIKFDNKNISIADNGSNYYMEPKINNENVVKEYFNLYKKIALSKPEIIYNIMSEEYRNLRFGNFDNFEKYVNNNYEEIKKINLKQYLVNYYDNYTEYVGKDQFGNLYVFDEYKGEKIQIKLDTYTLTTNKFIEEYEKAEEQKRVQMNVDKFIQMINRSDFTTSYNCISEGFRNNYFSTLEDFKDFIQYNFFKYNKLEFKNIEKKGSNIYVCTVQLSDLTEQTQDIKEINIIMQLNDGINFEMSFGM
mgnify:CR=1 FL=1